MVLLLSETRDHNTNLIVRWLMHDGVAFRRINSDEDNCRLCSYDSSTGEIILSLDGEILRSSDFDSYFYRRNALRNLFRRYGADRERLDNVFLDENDYAFRHLGRESKELADFLYFHFEQQIGRRFGSYFAELNKLTVSARAARLGLRIPATAVCDNRADLAALVGRKDGVVTKAISDGIYFQTPTYAYYSYTEQIRPDGLPGLPEYFFPSLFQDMIRKSFELRIFFLDDAFSAMAIFSQLDDNTKVDYRKSETATPSRRVPFTLPEPIRAKLSALTRELGLNTGSIDMMVDEQDEYYFLEINPVGQIGMTSAPCNYYLERSIATYLQQPAHA